MPRGGRRPGAGAPRGNTNALKTGRHSLRVRAVIDALLADRETRDILLRLGSKGEARNIYARELALAMARLMHERPIAEAARTLTHQLANVVVARDAADDVNADIAQFEQRRRRDAFTGGSLTRRPNRAPSDLRSAQYVRNQFPDPYRKSDNPPFTSALDRRPYPFGPNGDIDPEEYDRLLDEWEQQRHRPEQDDPPTEAGDPQ